MIPCSEKCLYEDNGLCILEEATKPSNTPTKDCPYFKEKGSKKEGS